MTDVLQRDIDIQELRDNPKALAAAMQDAGHLLAVARQAVEDGAITSDDVDLVERVLIDAKGLVRALSHDQYRHAEENGHLPPDLTDEERTAGQHLCRRLAAIGAHDAVILDDGDPTKLRQWLATKVHIADEEGGDDYDVIARFAELARDPDRHVELRAVGDDGQAERDQAELDAYLKKYRPSSRKGGGVAPAVVPKRGTIIVQGD